MKQYVQASLRHDFEVWGWAKTAQGVVQVVVGVAPAVHLQSIHLYSSLYVFIYPVLYVRRYLSLYIYVYTHMCMYICIYVCVYIYMYIYIHMFGTS